LWRPGAAPGSRLGLRWQAGGGVLQARAQPRSSLRKETSCCFCKKPPRHFKIQEIFQNCTYLAILVDFKWFQGL
jgi:hypothetical protein